MRSVCRPSFLWILLWLSLPMDVQGLTAVLTSVEGAVRVVEPGKRAPGLIALSLQVVREGQKLEAGTGSSLLAICSTERSLELVGPGEWSLTPEFCASGQRLPEGTYDAFVPRAGRPRALENVLVSTAAVRDPGESGLLVSPRTTRLLEPPEVILWRPVEGAFEYAIELSGRAQPILLEAATADCVRRSAWNDEILCALAWPGPSILEPEVEHFLAVGFSRGLAARFEHYGDKAALRLLGDQEARRVRRQLTQVAGLPLSPGERQFLSAEIYLRNGLWSAAVSAYQGASKELELPAASVALGDLFAATGLSDLATRNYQAALDSKDSAAAAAAALGLGCLYSTYARFDEAERYFRQASDYYRVAGLLAEAAMARIHADEVASREDG